MLSHLDPQRRLFLQVDGSLERGFGAVLFHLKEGYDWEPGTHIPATAVQPICFLSRKLTPAEQRYGPTELEVACLVWAVRRLRTSLQLLQYAIEVLTDYSATKQIVEKTTLATASTDRANRRLVVASIYLSEYDLWVYYLPGEKNFILDALSCLTAPETDNNPACMRPDYMALDDVLVAMEALMAAESKTRFREGYIRDPHYEKIISMILDKEVDLEALNGEDAVDALKRGLPFRLRDGLLYHNGIDGYNRLCVPFAMIDDMLKMAYDDQYHFGIE